MCGLYTAPRRKVITVWLAVRYLVVVCAIMGVFFLTVWPFEPFFHVARDVSVTIAGLVAGFVPIVLGRWVTRKERRTCQPLAAATRMCRHVAGIQTAWPRLRFG